MRVARAQGRRGGLLYDPHDPAEVHLAVTTNGHAWLSCLSDEEALERVARQSFVKEGFGPGAPTTIQEVMSYVATARERGYAPMVEGHQTGIAAVAVPIRRPDTGASIGTVSISGPMLRLTEQRLVSMTHDLRSSAEQLAVAASASPLFHLT